MNILMLGPFVSTIFLFLFLLYSGTMCPRSSDPSYIVSYYIKWVTTSWTHSNTCLSPWLLVVPVDGMSLLIYLQVLIKNNIKGGKQAQFFGCLTVLRRLLSYQISKNYEDYNTIKVLMYLPI